MPLPTTYRVGAVTVSANGTAVTGTGTNWLAGGIREGDIFAARGLTATIASVDNATSLTLSDPWAGPALTNAEYEIRYTPDSSRVLAAAKSALAAIEETYEGSRSAIAQAQLRKNSLMAARAPTKSDDASQGYGVGSRWLWQGREWVAAGVDAGAARWAPKDIALTPQMFGARADGVTNDHAAIQAAINAAALIGGEVRFPPGTYMVAPNLDLRAGVSLVGSGKASVLRSLGPRGTGTSGIGLQLVRGDNVSGFTIRDLTFDCNMISSRAINLNGCSSYQVRDNFITTMGAAVCSINCSYYAIQDNEIDMQAPNNIATSDGVIDQWWGSHHFRVSGNTLRGAGFAKYGILATGTTTDNVAAGCHDFHVSGNKVYDCISPIHLNGRSGINRNFHVDGNIVKGAATYHGLYVSDSDTFTVANNIIEDVPRVGLLLGRETPSVYACKNATVTGNIIRNANGLASASGSDGSGIVIHAGCEHVSLAANRVIGTQHTYAIWISPDASDVEVSGYDYDRGTQGLISRGAPANRIPGGTQYSPTVTGVLDVASVSAQPCIYTRDGDVITVSGRMFVTPAGANKTVRVAISLPVPSNLTEASTDLIGTASNDAGSVAGSVIADLTNDRAFLSFRSIDTAATTMMFSFRYLVK